MMSNSKSLTWSAHVRILFKIYGLPDPLRLLRGQAWPKDTWIQTVKAKVAAHHEGIWRSKAVENSKLNFFNVQVSGLAGRLHPVLTGILSTQEVMHSRVHIRMLAGDYPCQQYVSNDRNQDPSCPLCLSMFPGRPAQNDSMVHLLTMCRVTAETRARVIPDLLNILVQHFPNNDLLLNHSNAHLTQFILDPTSLNLPSSIRINPGHPGLTQVLTQCRRICFAVHKDRTRQLDIIKHKRF